MLQISLTFILLLKIINCDEFEYAATTTEDFNEPLIDSDADLSSLNTDVIRDYRLYVDNVISAVKDQNWSIGEQQCVDDFMLLLNNVKNATFWAIWKWDSMNTSPYGILYKTRYEFGNFDQCLSRPWSSQQSALQSQYCLVDVKLEGNKIYKNGQDLSILIDHYVSAKDVINTHYNYTRPIDVLTYGICAPKSCSPDAVEKIATALLSTSYLGILDTPLNVTLGYACQDGSEEKFNMSFYAFIITFIFLIFITTTCTFIARRLNCDKSLKTRIIEAFSLEKNLKSLLVINPGGLHVLYGIRYLTICLIVLCHQTGSYSAGPIINGRIVDEKSFSSFERIFLHLDVFVDTFYMMSGILTVSTFLNMKKFPNPIMLIMKRYARLATGFAVIIFYMCTVYSYTGSGPLWPQFVENEVGPCRRNWWISLLMINNYVNTDDYCVVISWYVPSDFQCFLVTMVLWYIYRKSKFVAFTLGTLLGIASAVSVGTLTYLYDLAPIQLFTPEFLENPRINKEFNMVYVKTHTRFAAYFIGLIGGYVLIKALSDDDRKRWSKKWSILGALIGIALMLIVLVTGPTMLSNDISSIEGAVYAAVNKPVWVLGMVLFICSCSLGSVPLISSFLKWYPWVPLSRLSYGLYLIHAMIIQRNVFISRQPQYIDLAHILVESCGVIVWGTIAALTMWLLVEAPVNNLLTICMSPRMSSSSDSERDQKFTNSNTTNGHLQDNLPSTIQISKI